jgi:hypothetical protein
VRISSRTRKSPHDVRTTCASRMGIR